MDQNSHGPELIADRRWTRWPFPSAAIRCMIKRVLSPPLRFSARAALRWGLPVLAALVLAGAVGYYMWLRRPRSCHPIGCFDGFTATIMAGPRGFPRGPHEVIVFSDGAARSCTFYYDEYVAMVGPSAAVTCSPGVGTGFAHTICGNGPESPPDCPPAGFETEMVSVSGKPASVRIIQIANQTVIFDRLVSPEYHTGTPGAACHVCTGASARWSLH